MLRTTNMNVHYKKCISRASEKPTTIQNVVPIHSNITVKFDSSIKERKKERKNDLEVAHPQCGFWST